jgi:hypothetical protein
MLMCQWKRKTNQSYKTAVGHGLSTVDFLPNIARYYLFNFNFTYRANAANT